jgi:hypothetical protein
MDFEAAELLCSPGSTETDNVPRLFTGTGLMIEGYFPHFFNIGYGAISGSSTHLATRASSSSVGAEQKGFTFDEYKEFVNTVCNGDDPILMDKSDYLINCFKLMSNEFMKDDGTPDFDSGEFRTLAEYINENVNFIDYPEDYDGYFKQIDEGNPAVYKCFNTIREYLGYAGTVPDGITVLGIPSSGRNGPSVYVTDSVAVSSSTKNKAGCIGFIKMLLSDA